MASMTRRLQIRIDEDRYHLLQRESERTGKSIAELIRHAIDVRYGPDYDKRRVAIEELLAVEPCPSRTET